VDKKRLFQLAGPPLLALAGAFLYTKHRLAQAEEDVAAFCAMIPRGMPARTFIERALEANLEVHDFGAESTTLVASTVVYAWKKETFECRAERDAAGLVSSTETRRRTD